MTRHPRRLPGAPPPPLAEPEELSESDALARMADLHDRELDARADPPPRVKPRQVHAPRIPEALRREVVRLHDKGDSYKRIAAATGIHRSTVQRIVERDRDER